MTEELLELNCVSFGKTCAEPRVGLEAQLLGSVSGSTAIPSYHFPTRFCLKRANICVFCDFALAADLSNQQQDRLLRESCPLGSSPAAPAIVSGLPTKCSLYRLFWGPEAGLMEGCSRQSGNTKRK
jgi:hypothetical protein